MCVRPPSFNGNKLTNTDYVCTEHENCYRLKYLSFKRGMVFATEYRYRKVIHDNTCAKCGIISQAVKIRAVQNMSTGLNDFIVNRMTSNSKPSTRSRSGFGDGTLLCSSCYQIVRKKYEAEITGTVYSPKKKLKPTHSGKAEDLNI